MYVPNLIKIGTVVLEKKMLTDDGRRTQDNENQHIPIGHMT